MPPKKRKQKATREDSMLIPTQAVPSTLLAPYHGPDRLSELPAEILTRICLYLHAPTERRFDAKDDLKAVNLTNLTLRNVAKAELFKCMKLKFRWKRVWSVLPTGFWSSWEVAKLIRMVEEVPELAHYVCEVMIEVLPMLLEDMDGYSGPRSYTQYLPMPDPILVNTFLINMPDHIKSKLVGTQARILDTYGYVDDGNIHSVAVRDPRSSFTCPVPDEHPEDYYYHIFGRANDHGICSRETIHIWAAHVLDGVRRRSLPHLTNVKHLETGIWPRPPGWAKREYDYVSQWGLAFANALVLKIGSLGRTTSLSLHQLP